MDAPLVGFRCWRRGDQDVLLATIQNTHWDAIGVNTAVCLTRRMHPYYPFTIPAPADDQHEAPTHGCTCGIYAYDRLRTAEFHAATGVVPMRSLLLGAVLLWGRVLVAQVCDPEERLDHPGLRYRAQFASIVALRREDTGADEIGRAQGIPVVHGAYLEAYARERGEQLRKSTNNDIGGS